ncbi:MAG TPA: class I SAM-dependent RNA methyltransferase [Bacteroidales bacterium]|nr:class I SAM-dependent RNA methyltransferase [Bacteroidales bacterium]
MKFVAKTLFGLEKVLAKEIEQSGAHSVRIVNRAVMFEGDKSLLYRGNYCFRTALSILMTVSEFRIKTKEDLYRGGLKIKWENYMNAESSFSVVPVINSTVFSHTGYPALILKDAIADYFRSKKGIRPSVDTKDPDIVVNLHISNDAVNISLDSTVIPLYKRGYRKEQPEAPLNEVLAAGIIMLSGWDGSVDFLDPMCGSGTFPIEAGLIACKIPAGRFRKHFGFMRWRDYDPDLFQNIKTEADNLISDSSAMIYASDISEKAVRQARSNISEAGLQELIKPELIDFKDISQGDHGMYIFMNPPYGLRLQPEEIDELYSMIGSTMKHKFPGSTGWIITPNREALKNIGLKPSEKFVLFNGALECLLLRYDLYSGSRKPVVSSQKSV